MKLRQQLLILSLIILSLPWAGCQYVREMERVMLDGQEREMLASARAVALRLSEEPGLFAGADEKTSDASIYFHNLTSAPDLDGYADEWRGWALSPVEMSAVGMKPLSPVQVQTANPVAEAQVRSGLYAGDLYLHLDIYDQSPAFADPGLGELKNSDYLEMVIAGGESLFIFASSPGPIVVHKTNASGELENHYQFNGQLSGYWLDSADNSADNGRGINQRGHQIELRINQSLLGEQLALRYVDYNVRLRKQTRIPLELGFELGAPTYYAKANPMLEKDIGLFAMDDLRLGLSDRTGWLLGSAGSLMHENDNEQQSSKHWLLDLMYSHILRSSSYAQLDNWQSEGKFKTLDVKAALLGQIRTARYTKNNQRIVRAVFPVQRGGEMLGAVIAEKSSADVVSATGGAFGRLIFWVLAVTLFVSLGLLIYATVLSLRIQRLSRAATEAMTDPASGNLSTSFPVSNLSDEVGDLSRNYYELLTRLDEYTLYLKTLSSKLSHELRTPLAVIRSSLDNLEHEKLTPDSSVFLERAVDGVARLSAILNAMSGASRLEESIKNSEFETVDIGALLCSVVAGYRGAYPEAEFSLEMLEDSFTARVSPELLVQMLDKLVDNACDFCVDEGQISIGLEVTEAEWHLTVKNPGPLLPENMKAQLFDSLVSVRDQKADQPHLGLGLNIVRLIAEYHGAKATADNLPDGSGVEFRVSFALV